MQSFALFLHLFELCSISPRGKFVETYFDCDDSDVITRVRAGKLLNSLNYEILAWVDHLDYYFNILVQSKLFGILVSFIVSRNLLMLAE